MTSFVSGTNLLEQAGVALTTIGDTTGLSGRNLLTATLAEVWRTVANTGTVQADLGTAQAAQAIVLAAPRDGLLPMAGSTVRVTASNSSQTGTDVYDSTAVTLSLPLGYQCWVLSAPVSARWWQVVVSAPSTQAYLQFGRLWIGPGLLTGCSLRGDSYRLDTVDDPGRASIRRASYTLGTLTEAEAQALEDIGIAAGTQRQVLAVPRPTKAPRSAILGKFTAVPAPRAWQGFGPSGQLYEADLAIQEDR